MAKRPEQVVFGETSTPVPMQDKVTGHMHALQSEADKIFFNTYREDRSRSGNTAIESEDDRITAQDRLYAELMRLLPTRSMLPYLKHELAERDPYRDDWDKHSYYCHYEGPPGAGKSFMNKMLGKLAHPKGALILNCTGTDMSSIFCEIVFDTSAANKEKAAIDAKIYEGNVNPKRGLSDDSKQLLKRVLGDAFHEGDEEKGEPNRPGVVSIDWNAVRVQGESVEEQEQFKKVMQSIILRVCEIEGIAVTSDISKIGITTRDGIAIRAADPTSADYGRPILLDEINLAKAGTLPKLYDFVAFLSNSDENNLDVIGGQNKPFHFKREKLPLTYRVNSTSNPKSKGLENRDSFDRALKSRAGEALDFKKVPDATIADYTDRIAQAITGVPLAQIYYSAKKEFDANPELFAKVLKKYRTAALDDSEKKNVPQEEIINIQSAKKILQMSEQLGEFFNGLRQLTDPESEAYKTAETSISPEYADYLSKIEIDLRLVTKMLQKSSIMMPEGKKSDNVSYAGFAEGRTPNATPHKVALEERLGSRGKRLEQFVLNWLHDVVVPADHVTLKIPENETDEVYKMALQLAAKHGIGKADFKDAAANRRASIASLYDVNLLLNPTYQAKKLQEVLIDHTISAAPTGSDEDIRATVTPQLVQAALKQAEQVDLQGAAQPADVRQMVVPSGKTNALFKRMTLKDSLPADKKNNPAEFPAEQLESNEAVLIALSVPTLLKKNATMLFNTAPSVHTEPSDESVKISENRSDSKIGMTTLMVKNDNGSAEPLHLVTNFESKKIVAVGGDINDNLARLLNQNGIRYVNYHEADSAGRANEAVDDLMAGFKGNKTMLLQDIKGALLLRNGIDSETGANRKKQLGTLLTTPERVPPIMPVYAYNMSVGDFTQAYKSFNRDGSGSHGVS